ncbi:hypothetical protein predicted by Glimmer/Critica [Acetobacter ghanensis]|uniref:Uncharacterized protein n=1 Tax=Acetobacter ghanensis TaxID=431306 RepID=A0A0U5FWD9_9PROT|nr:hypothetical protein predicted by Glimmer/Critica [Acetobacter ghanensis]
MLHIMLHGGPLLCHFFGNAGTCGKWSASGRTEGGRTSGISRPKDAASISGISFMVGKGCVCC